jgi:serralysin
MCIICAALPAYDPSCHFTGTSNNVFGTVLGDDAQKVARAPTGFDAVTSAGIAGQITIPPTTVELDTLADFVGYGYWSSVGANWRTWHSNTITVNTVSLGVQGAQLADWALEIWTDYTGINFVNTFGIADISFVDTGPGASASTSTYFGSNEISSSQINIAASWLTSYGSTLNSYGLQTYLHEIGHALGLGHAGPYDGSATYATNAISEVDSWQFSLMSYFSQTQNTDITASYAFAATPMSADILAMISLYGGLSPAFAGNTTYGVGGTLSGAVGMLYDYFIGEGAQHGAVFSGAAAIAMTFYDTSGYNRVVFNNDTTNQTVNLAAGGIWDVYGRVGNFILARDAVLNEFHAGSGADEIVANNLGNQIFAGVGNDTVTGGTGADTLYGGPGYDSVDGGGGRDLIFGATGNDTLNGGSGADTIWTGNGNNVVSGGEDADSITAGTGNDTLNGGSGDDTIAGGEGADQINGDAGDDWLFGGGGSDAINGGADNDLISGGGGLDTLIGGAGNDTLVAGEDDTRMEGTSGANWLWDGAGADLIYGGVDGDAIIANAGANTVFGGTGADTISIGSTGNEVHGGGAGDAIWSLAGSNLIYGDGGADQIVLRGTNDTVHGGSGDDTIVAAFGSHEVHGTSGNNHLWGGSGNTTFYAGTDNDTIIGGSGNDTIIGSSGANVLIGGGGADRIVAGIGADVMKGDVGADVFVFATAAEAGWGATRDQITDFQVGVDRIDVSAIAGLSFIGSNTFTGTGPQLRYVADSGFIIGDSDGDAIGDFAIVVWGLPALTVDDFIF